MSVYACVYICEFMDVSEVDLCVRAFEHAHVCI